MRRCPCYLLLPHLHNLFGSQPCYFVSSQPLLAPVHGVAFFPLIMCFQTPLPPTPSGNVSWLFMDPPKPALWPWVRGVRGHLPHLSLDASQPWALAVRYVCQDCFLYSVSIVSKELLTHSELSPRNRNRFSKHLCCWPVLLLLFLVVS